MSAKYTDKMSVRESETLRNMIRICAGMKKDSLDYKLLAAERLLEAGKSYKNTCFLEGMAKAYGDAGRRLERIVNSALDGNFDKFDM